MVWPLPLTRRTMAGGVNNVRCRLLMPVTQYCTERAYAMTTRHGGSIERVMWSCFTAEVPTSERLQRWVCRTQCCHDHNTQTLPLLSNNHSLSVRWVVCGKGLENEDDLFGWKRGGAVIKCNRMIKQLKKFGMLTAIANVIRLPLKKVKHCVKGCVKG